MKNAFEFVARILPGVLYPVRLPANLHTLAFKLAGKVRQVSIMPEIQGDDIATVATIWEKGVPVHTMALSNVGMCENADGSVTGRVTMSSIRFFQWFNDGYVKLSLTADKPTLEIHEGGPSEEGYQYNHHTYNFEDGRIVSQFDSEASDCDGRLDYHWMGSTDINMMTGQRPGFIPSAYGESPKTGLDKLEALYHESIEVPEWIKEYAGRRDYEAEKAGY